MKNDDDDDDVVEHQHFEIFKSYIWELWSWFFINCWTIKYTYFIKNVILVTF